MDEAFVRHYGDGIERDRLIAEDDSLELVRTLSLLQTALPPPPARILDVRGVVERLVGVEGHGGWFEAAPEIALTAAGLAEEIPALSPHMLCLARR